MFGRPNYERIFKDPNLEEVKPTDTTLVMFNKTQVSPLGQRTVQVKNPKNNKMYKVLFLIVEHGCRPVPKPNGKIRLCIDPKPFNKALKRNHYPLCTNEDVLPELAKARIFSVVDVKNGFWHVKLDNERSKLTTFATLWGRYRWLRMPFGISPAPEEFQRRLNEALEGLSGVKAVADDILLWGTGNTDSEASRDHDVKLCLSLDRLRAKGIGSSPCQRLYSRRTRTLLPISNELLQPKVVESSTKLKERKAKQSAYYNMLRNYQI